MVAARLVRVAIFRRYDCLGCLELEQEALQLVGEAGATHRHIAERQARDLGEVSWRQAEKSRVRVGVDEIFTRETPCARDAPLRPVSPAEVEAAAEDAPPRRGGGRGGRGGGARRDARSSR